MLFGREITEQIWHDGQHVGTKHVTEESVVVSSHGDVLTATLKALALVKSKQTPEVTIELIADPKTFEPKRMVIRTESRK